MSLHEKEERLRSVLREYESVAVAFSGGVDSTLLAAFAFETLGEENTLLINGLSPSLAPDEADFVSRFANARGIPLRIIETHELDNEEYQKNPPNRCYFCKTELFSLMKPIAEDAGMKVVVDGANADDLGDFRPGHQAAAEQGVHHPFQEAGMTKDDIRELSQIMGLPTWDKPAMACLASRFPYGEILNEEKLIRVAEAEMFLRELAFREFRVRSHEDLARLEFATDEFRRAIEHRERITAHLKMLGFTWVTIDLTPFKSGSMNRMLSEEEKILA